MISTRGRYALRVLTDLAEHRKGGAYIPMREIAARQGISLKYIGQILPILTHAGLIEGLPGKGGGYRLCREPEQCTTGEVLRLTEGDLAPVACLATGSEPCGRAAKCRTLPLWRRYMEVTNKFFDSVTLADLIREK